MFLGDNVRDEYFDYAVFEELGSSPPSMEAARAIDALSMFIGYDSYEETQADAISA